MRRCPQSPARATIVTALTMTVVLLIPAGRPSATGTVTSAEPANATAHTPSSPASAPHTQRDEEDTTYKYNARLCALIAPQAVDMLGERDKASNHGGQNPGNGGTNTCHVLAKDQNALWLAATVHSSTQSAKDDYTANTEIWFGGQAKEGEEASGPWGVGKMSAVTGDSSDSLLIALLVRDDNLSIASTFFVEDVGDIPTDTVKRYLIQHATLALETSRS